MLTLTFLKSIPASSIIYITTKYTQNVRLTDRQSYGQFGDARLSQSLDQY